MERIPRPGEIYQHFKGNLYRIVTLAQHSESGEQLVIYQALYDDYKVYARPLQMFLEEVDREKYPQVKAQYRFTRLPLVETAADRPLPAAESAVMVSAAVEQAVQMAGPAAQADQPAENVQDTELARGTGTAANAESDENTEEEFALDPMLLAFLDADSYERKLEIFDSLRGRADESMLNTIAISLDLELSDGDLDEQFQTLRNCMLTLEKYECNRLR